MARPLARHAAVDVAGARRQARARGPRGRNAQMAAGRAYCTETSRQIYAVSRRHVVATVSGRGRSIRRTADAPACFVESCDRSRNLADVRAPVARESRRQGTPGQRSGSDRAAGHVQVDDRRCQHDSRARLVDQHGIRGRGLGSRRGRRGLGHHADDAAADKLAAMASVDRRRISQRPAPQLPRARHRPARRSRQRRHPADRMVGEPRPSRR